MSGNEPEFGKSFYDIGNPLRRCMIQFFIPRMHEYRNSGAYAPVDSVHLGTVGVKPLKIWVELDPFQASPDQPVNLAFGIFKIGMDCAKAYHHAAAVFDYPIIDTGYLGGFRGCGVEYNIIHAEPFRAVSEVAQKPFSGHFD